MPKKTKTQPATRKVNQMLSNGLYVISAKNRIDTSLYTLYLTDFVGSTRVILDAESGKVLSNKHHIELNAKDMRVVLDAIGVEAKKDVVVEAGKKLEEAKAKLVDVKVNVLPVEYGIEFDDVGIDG